MWAMGGRMPDKLLKLQNIRKPLTSIEFYKLNLPNNSQPRRKLSRLGLSDTFKDQIKKLFSKHD